MQPNRSSRRVHNAEFKARVLAECRQPGASVSAVSIAHGLNANVVRKWLAGRNLKRMGVGAAAGDQPALRFLPVELTRPDRSVESPAVPTDIRIELERGGLQLKLRCTTAAAAAYAAQLRAVADALSAA